MLSIDFVCVHVVRLDMFNTLCELCYLYGAPCVRVLWVVLRLSRRTWHLLYCRIQKFKVVLKRVALDHKGSCFMSEQGNRLEKDNSKAATNSQQGMTVLDSCCTDFSRF